MVRMGAINAVIPGPAIGYHSCVCVNELRNRRLQNFPARVRSQSHCNLAATLNDTHNRLLVLSSTSTLALPRAAEVTLIDLHCRFEWQLILFLGTSDSMPQKPSSLLRNVEVLGKLYRANTLRMVRDKVNRREPRPERNVRALHNRFRRHLELLLTCRTLVLIAIRELVNLLRIPTMWTYGLAAPHDFFKVLRALRFIVEMPSKGKNAAERIECFHTVRIDV